MASAIPLNRLWVGLPASDGSKFVRKKQKQKYFLAKMNSARKKLGK